MILRQKTIVPIDGYWDGGPKDTFNWHIEKHRSNSHTSRIGSWEANWWFTVQTGPTDKATLGNARRALQNRRNAVKSSFEYIEEE